jgi:hypothetical protein
MNHSLDQSHLNLSDLDMEDLLDQNTIVCPLVSVPATPEQPDAKFQEVTFVMSISPSPVASQH